MLADYERVGVVARGAHSTIWKGFDPGLKRDVALKQLSGSGAAEAARREAAALAGLRHPNILSVYDVLDDAEGVWLIEQWITGAPLTAVLAVTGKLRGIDALALIHGALQGLSYAHGRDVVHGDITPANILIDESGTPMLVDFGLAVTPGHLSLGGTPGYMAPEAAAGRPVDKRSDVYGSCVVLAELLTGARLFTNVSSLALTREQASAAPRLDGIEAPVAAVLTIGLQPRPDDRPADAETLLTQLESAIEETHGRRWLAAAGLGAIGSTAATIAGGIELTTATATASTGTTAATATASTGTTAAKSGTSTPSRGKLIAVAATVAALIVVIVAFLLLRSTPPPPRNTAATPPPGAAATPPPAAAASPPMLSGTYQMHFGPTDCGAATSGVLRDTFYIVNVQGNTINFGKPELNGPLNADGSFTATDTSFGMQQTYRGVFATEGGHQVIRDGDYEGYTPAVQITCHTPFTGTKFSDVH
jgi:serine/threonine protein kinase